MYTIYTFKIWPIFEICIISNSVKLSMLEQTFSSSFEVEQIVDQKIIDGQIHFLVKWIGYGHEENTWEPLRHMKHSNSKIKEWQDYKIKQLKFLQNQKGLESLDLRTNQKSTLSAGLDSVIKISKPVSNPYKRILSVVPLYLENQSQQKEDEKNKIKTIFDKPEMKKFIKEKKTDRKKKQLQLFEKRIKSRPKVWQQYLKNQQEVVKKANQKIKQVIDRVYGVNNGEKLDLRDNKKDQTIQELKSQLTTTTNNPKKRDLSFENTIRIKENQAKEAMSVLEILKPEPSNVIKEGVQKQKQSNQNLSFNSKVINCEQNEKQNKIYHKKLQTVFSQQESQESYLQQKQRISLNKINQTRKKLQIRKIYGVNDQNKISEDQQLEQSTNFMSKKQNTVRLLKNKIKSQVSQGYSKIEKLEVMGTNEPLRQQLNTKQCQQNNFTDSTQQQINRKNSVIKIVQAINHEKQSALQVNKEQNLKNTKMVDLSQKPIHIETQTIRLTQIGLRKIKQIQMKLTEQKLIQIIQDNTGQKDIMQSQQDEFKQQNQKINQGINQFPQLSSALLSPQKVIIDQKNQHSQNSQNNRENLRQNKQSFNSCEQNNIIQQLRSCNKNQYNNTYNQNCNNQISQKQQELNQSQLNPEKQLSTQRPQKQGLIDDLKEQQNSSKNQTLYNKKVNKQQQTQNKFSKQQQQHLQLEKSQSSQQDSFSSSFQQSFTMKSQQITSQCQQVNQKQIIQSTQNCQKDQDMLQQRQINKKDHQNLKNSQHFIPFQCSISTVDQQITCTNQDSRNRQIKYSETHQKVNASRNKENLQSVDKEIPDQMAQQNEDLNPAINYSSWSNHVSTTVPRSLTNNQNTNDLGSIYHFPLNILRQQSLSTRETLNTMNTNSIAQGSQRNASQGQSRRTDNIYDHTNPQMSNRNSSKQTVKDQQRNQNDIQNIHQQIGSQFRLEMNNLFKKHSQNKKQQFGNQSQLSKKTSLSLLQIIEKIDQLSYENNNDNNPINRSKEDHHQGFQGINSQNVVPNGHSIINKNIKLKKELSSKLIVTSNIIDLVQVQNLAQDQKLHIKIQKVILKKATNQAEIQTGQVFPKQSERDRKQQQRQVLAQDQPIQKNSHIDSQLPKTNIKIIHRSLVECALDKQPKCRQLTKIVRLNESEKSLSICHKQLLLKYDTLISERQVISIKRTLIEKD